MEQSMTAELLRVLNGQLALTQRLDDLGREKEARLVRGDVSGLSETLAREEETAAELERLEEERRQAAALLAQRLGLEEGSPALSRLAERLEQPEDKAALEAAGAALGGKMRDIVRRNSRLHQLLEQQQRYTDFMLNMLLGGQDGAQFYNMQGAREENATPLSKLDIHA